MIVLVLTAPSVLLASSTIQPDGSAIVAGAAMVLATLRWEQRRWHWLVPALVGAAAVSLKITNGLVVGLCVLYLVFRYAEDRITGRQTVRRATFPRPRRRVEHDRRAHARRERGVHRRRGRPRRARMVGAPARDPALSGNGPPDQQGLPGLRFPFHSFFDSLVRRLLAIAAPLHSSRDDDHDHVAGLDDRQRRAARGNVIGAVWAGRGSRLRALGGASLFAMLVVGPVFTLADYLFFGVYYPGGIAPGYGLSIVPAAALVSSVVPRPVTMAPLRRRRVGAWTAVITIDRRSPVCTDPPVSSVP